MEAKDWLHLDFGLAKGVGGIQGEARGLRVCARSSE